MYQYSNGYNCAIDAAGETVVIHFTQRAPAFNTDGNIESVEINPVASIMMNRDMAKALGTALKNLVDESEQNAVE